MNKYIYRGGFNFTLFFFLDSTLPTVIFVSQHKASLPWYDLLPQVLEIFLKCSRSVTELRHYTRVSQSHPILFSWVQKFAPQAACWGISTLLCQSAFPFSKLLWIQKTVPLWKLFHKYPKWANCYQYRLTDLGQN